MLYLSCFWDFLHAVFFVWVVIGKWRLKISKILSWIRRCASWIRFHAKIHHIVLSFIFEISYPYGPFLVVWGIVWAEKRHQRPKLAIQGHWFGFWACFFDRFYQKSAPRGRKEKEREREEEERKEEHHQGRGRRPSEAECRRPPRAASAPRNGSFFVILPYGSFFVVRCELSVSRVSVAVEKCQDDAVGHSRALPGVILSQDLESPADSTTGTTLLWVSGL